MENVMFDDLRLFGCGNTAGKKIRFFVACSKTNKKKKLQKKCVLHLKQVNAKSFPFHRISAKNKLKCAPQTRPHTHT